MTDIAKLFQHAARSFDPRMENLELSGPYEFLKQQPDISSCQDNVIYLWSVDGELYYKSKRNEAGEEELIQGKYCQSRSTKPVESSNDTQNHENLAATDPPGEETKVYFMRNQPEKKFLAKLSNPTVIIYKKHNKLYRVEVEQGEIKSDPTVVNAGLLALCKNIYTIFEKATESQPNMMCDVGGNTKKNIITLIQHSVPQEKIVNYNQTMTSSDKLGEALQAMQPASETNHNSEPKSKEQKKQTKNQRIAKLYDKIGSTLEISDIDEECFHHFFAAWVNKGPASVDDHSGNIPIEEYIKAKSHLNVSPRHNIYFALYFLYLHSITTQTEPKQEIICNPSLIRSGNQAISNYKPLREIVINYVSKGLGFLAALAGGLILFATALLLFHATWWAFVIAGFLLIASTWASKRIFFNSMPEIFASLLYKDIGLFQYTDMQGNKHQLSTGRKWLTFVCAGLAIVAVIFTSVIRYTTMHASFLALGKIAIFTFLATGTATAIFPYVAIGLCALYAIGIATALFKKFVALLQTKNIKEALLKPFKVLHNFYIKNGFKTILLAIPLAALAIYGFGSIVYSGVFSMNAILAPHIQKLFALIITIGCAILNTIARTPFFLIVVSNTITIIISTLLNTFHKMANYLVSLVQKSKPSLAEAEKSLPQTQPHKSWWSSIKTFFVGVAALLNGFGTGMFAITKTLVKGAILTAFSYLRLAGGTFFYLCASIGSVRRPTKIFKNPSEEQLKSSYQRLNQVLALGEHTASEIPSPENLGQKQIFNNASPARLHRSARDNGNSMGKDEQEQNATLRHDPRLFGPPPLGNSQIAGTGESHTATLS